MTCATPACGGTVTHRLLLKPGPAGGRGRIARVCAACRTALVADGQVAKERQLVLSPTVAPAADPGTEVE